MPLTMDVLDEAPRRLTLDEWDERYAALRAAGLREPAYGGPISRHLEDGDRRLSKLRFDNSPAALRLWNFLLTEEERLHALRRSGHTLIGVMKDLGTTAMLAYCLPRVTAFYPDGAWWLPCVMEDSTGLLAVADGLGVPASFCPVRAMLGAFVTQKHFPLPDLLTCSVGATCDDFSAIAQRLESLGHPILWWEMPHRRCPEPGEPAVTLPGGCCAPREQVEFVQGQLERVRHAMEDVAGARLDEAALRAGVRQANYVRGLLDELRQLAYRTPAAPLPALEMLIAEMLAIHYCSDPAEAAAILDDLLGEVRRRVRMGTGVMPADAARVFWVNPVADLCVMNSLEACGGRMCGTDYLFLHALDPIAEDLPPMEALARSALADPMVGSARQRAERICAEVRRFGAEAVLVSRIPGASHCATECEVIAEVVQEQLRLPVAEIEVPSITDALSPHLHTRMEALVETAKARR